jgi:hypothetical protein
VQFLLEKFQSAADRGPALLLHLAAGQEEVGRAGAGKGAPQEADSQPDEYAWRDGGMMG